MLLAAVAYMFVRPGFQHHSKERLTPASDSEVAQWSQIRKHIKHVFVLYQENRSFDHYFGTFPGAEGLFSNPASQTPGFYQEMIGLDGKPMSVHPFRIVPREYAADTSDVDHSHEAIVLKMHLIHGQPQMDQFALTEEKEHFKAED